MEMGEPMPNPGLMPARWMRRSTPGVVAGAAVAAGVGTTLVLRRMRQDLLGAGRLTPATTVAMYCCYCAHAAATAVAVTRGGGRLPLPHAAVSGAAVATAGTGLCVAGMSRFTGPGQVSGTDPATVVADGVYRISRNPQYLGYLAALTGLSVARRSPAAMALTAAAAVIYRWWVPIEERHLSEAFGANYDHYRDRTPRWLGPAQPPPRSNTSPSTVLPVVVASIIEPPDVTSSSHTESEHPEQHGAALPDTLGGPSAHTAGPALSQ